MDKQGFRAALGKRNLSEQAIAASLLIAERFDHYIEGKPAEAGTVWAFSRQLIAEGSNTQANYLALVRYCLFLRKHAMYAALLELVDGAEVAENLYRLTAERFGLELRDAVFDGYPVAPLGTPTPEKPASLQPVIERLEAHLGRQACADFLSASLRDLPDEFFLEEREKYKQAGGMDAYLVRRKQDFMAQLEACLREERPFFSQVITRQVIEYVRNDPEMGGGRREGDRVYEVKIPFMTREYLAETDPALKRYHYCHCPWAREAVRDSRLSVAATFCNCSAGFHKKPFEVIFGQPLKADVLESVLKGDLRCRFAIHLPAQAVS